METLPVHMDSLATGYDFRKSVMLMQEGMLQMPQADCPLIHRFANGVYAREVTIPANTIVIGKIHKHEMLNFLMKGEITVVTETGKVRLVAPCTFVSPPGTKKAAYTHSEVIWTNVCATQSLDLEEIEREMVCDDYDACFLNHVVETLRIEE
jgi:hypothetical protein